MHTYLASPNAIAVFLALVYGLEICVCLAWGITLRRVRVRASAASALFTAVGMACMFIPLLSLYVLLLICGEPQAFVEFLLSWLKVDLRVLVAFLVAPIPPIVALITYVGIAKKAGILDAGKLKQVIGSEGFTSSKALGVLGVGYVAGVSVNAFVAIGEEIGWRSYLTPALINHVGLAAAIVIVGIVWGLWHVPINLAVKPLVERALPWVTLRLMLLSNVVSFIVLSYPLYLLLAVSRSVLPPAAFHRTINALWRVPQFVTRASDERRYGDVAKAMLIS